MEKTIKIVLIVIFGVLFFVGLEKVIDRKLNSFKSESTNIITLKERERQLDCLTRNIYYEAATEPFEGKVGVAQVTLNRAESEKFPNDICRVVYQKNTFYDKVVCQFSWYCKTKSLTKPINTVHFKESESVAKKVLLEGFRLDSLKEALYYHADYVNPGWKKERIIKIGRHIFYKG